MRPKNLAILFAVTALAVIAAVVTSSGTVSAVGPRNEALAGYPSFSERINDVVEVEVVGHDHRFRVAKSPEGGWGLVDRDGYPVSLEKVKDVVVRLAELEPLDTMSSRKENFARMGLQDPAEEGSPAKRVILRDSAGGTIADLIVGNTKYKGRTPAVFVRTGDDKTWQCEGRLTFEADPMGWLEREIVEIESGKVKSLVIEHADGETIRIARKGDTREYELLDPPPGKQESFAGVANGPATALSYLRLDDVRPLEQVDFTAQPVCKAVYACEDGLVLSLEIARFEDADWVRMNASYQAPEGAETVGPPTPGETPSAEAEAAKHAEVEARSLQRNFDRWAYKLPEFKVQGIAKRGAELWIDVPAVPPSEDPSQPSPGQ